MTSKAKSQCRRFGHDRGLDGCVVCGSGSRADKQRKLAASKKRRRERLEARLSDLEARLSAMEEKQC